MTGLDAARTILAAAASEIVVDVVARVLQTTRRAILREYQR